MGSERKSRRWVLGPGILLAATSIGGSHLLMASRAGAEHGLALLWLVLATHLLKYPAFAAGPRYAAATGASLLWAYAKVPAGRFLPRRWALWLGILDMTVESAGVIAAVVALTAAILAHAIPALSLPAAAVLVVITVWVLLLTGGYRYLRGVNLVLMALLLIGTLAAFAVSGAERGWAGALVTPTLPEGSGDLAAAMLGWMPTALGVSVWHSVWVLRDQRLWGVHRETRWRIRTTLTDMRVGYVLSFVIGFCFLLLGAGHLFPTTLPDDGAALAATLTKLYTASLGEWMRPVFLALAFFAMFSTTYASMDGFPRTLLDATAILRGTSEGAVTPSQVRRQKAYWGFLLVTSTIGLTILWLFPSPKLLVTVLAGITFLVSPIYLWLNHYVVTRQLPPEHRPGAVGRFTSLFCAIALTVAPVLFLFWLL